MITPLEIENKKFSKKTLNGYDPEEVDEFLDDLTKDYGSLYKQVAENKKEVEELKSKLEHYTQIESTLQSTLLLAQSASEEVKSAAQKQADQIIKESELKAKQATDGLEKEITERKKELESINKEFDVYKAKMESLLIAQLEILKEIKSED